MSTKTVFCEECRDDVEYIVTSVPMTGTIKDMTYSYMGKEARCVNCGSLVFVPEISDFNLQCLYDVYRDKNGIISLNMVRQIPEKYNIGKRPLSLLLGWGEQTFSRYYDGDVPTRQYSDILLRIYNDPQFFLEILETNKENLKSTISYEKSRCSVNSLLAMNAPKKSKIYIVIQYLLNQCEDITPMALQKGLYYIQGFYYAFYKSFLFMEDCQAWIHGPVYRDVYFQYRDYHFEPIDKVNSFDVGVFSTLEKAVCDSVINSLCCYSGKVLERFTHNETPWLITRGNLPSSAPSDRIIEKTVIGEYFESVKIKYNMVNPCDIKDYAQNMFLQILA